MEGTIPSPPLPTPSSSGASLPLPIDTRACMLATQIVEGHYESATGSHMHWLYRELSKLMHRDFALSVREEANLKAASNGGDGSRGRNKRRNTSGHQPN